MLERWNDDKMDALAAEVRGLGTELREQRREMREQRNEMKAGFERVDDRFDRMQRTLVMIAGAIIVALIGAPHL
jgi:hypothetical protein